jgi:uncharacterized membrane protein
MFLEADSPPFVHHSVPNRSLGPAGRRIFLAAIAVTTLGIATGAVLIGAWPVMPFAGIEVAAVFFAFHLVRLHDADFERLEIGPYEVRVESRRARTHTRFVAHRAWARVIVRQEGARITLGLAYAGRTVELGRLMSDEGRRKLAEDLRGRITLAAK